MDSGLRGAGNIASRPADDKVVSSTCRCVAGSGEEINPCCDGTFVCGIPLDFPPIYACVGSGRHCDFAVGVDPCFSGAAQWLRLGASRN